MVPCSSSLEQLFRIRPTSSGGACVRQYCSSSIMCVFYRLLRNQNRDRVLVSCTVVGEKVNRIMSSLTGKDEEKSDKKENIERLEMAHIKMEAALQVSNRWQITDRQLLQWQRGLKRAAQECDNALVRCKQQAIEEEQMRQQVCQSSFPKRFAHATKSLISSFTGVSNGKDESSSSLANVQKFEKFANGANELLKTIQFGGALRRYTFFNPLIRQLLTGKSVRHQVSLEDKFYQLNLRSMSSAERGVEAMMGFSCQDFSEPENGFYIASMLRLSESTDIFGVIMKCVQAVAPHFKFAAEGIRRGLIQLPAQDFFWDLPYSESEFWVNVHNTMTQLYRPNPLCCSEHRNHPTSSSSTNNTMASSSRLLSNIFPEEVINMYLKWHVPLSDQGTGSKSLTAVHGGCRSPNSELPLLKLGVLLIPHQCAEDIEPAVESYAFDVIDGKKQENIHTNADLEDLGDKLLPRAIDYLHQNSESKLYQMSWKSRHGTAHLCVEKSTTEIQTAGIISEATRPAQNKREITLQEDRERWKRLSDDLLRLWVVRGSDKLQGSIMDTRNFA